MYLNPEIVYCVLLDMNGPIVLEYNVHVVSFDIGVGGAQITDQSNDNYVYAVLSLYFHDIHVYRGVCLYQREMVI